MALLRITKRNYSYSTGKLLVFFFIIISIYLEDRNVIARFDEIPSTTLQSLDIKETVYTKAIKNYKGKQH